MTIAGPRENARIGVAPDATVSMYVGSTNFGQGYETICVRVVADALNVSITQIRLILGSTTYLHESFGPFHSRSVVMAGSVILAVADRLKEEIQTAVAVRLDYRTSQLAPGVVLVASYSDMAISVYDFARLGLPLKGPSKTICTPHRHTYSHDVANLLITRQRSWPIGT